MAGFHPTAGGLFCPTADTNDRRMSRRCPYGWKPDPENPRLMVKEEQEQAITSRIVALRQAGQSLRAIRAALGAEGLGFRHRGTWHRTTIQKVLRRAGLD